MNFPTKTSTTTQPRRSRAPPVAADVYEDAEQCPYCGTYITSQTSPWAGRSVWWIVLAVLGLLATILVLSGLVP